MKTIPFHLMNSVEYSKYQLEEVVSIAMNDSIGLIKDCINQAPCFTDGLPSKVTLTQVVAGVLSRCEKAALYYVQNCSIQRLKKEYVIACVKWRSCADLMFPNLRRYMDDEIRDSIIAKHSDYSIFAVEALKHDLDKSEIRGLLLALASNVDTVQIAVDYVREHGEANPWDYTMVIARCAYTSEKLAWELIKEYPKPLVLSSAVYWHSIAVQVENTKNVDNQVIDNCIRFHEDIAQKYVNTKNNVFAYQVLSFHPQLRERLTRRTDLAQQPFLRVCLEDWKKEQRKIQFDLASKLNKTA